MYEQFYGLRDKPFSLTPNPRFVLCSKQYQDAADQLIYGINNREGLMIVTGETGTGKTTLCYDLIERLDRDGAQSALIVNPLLNGLEMLAALLTEFGIAGPPGALRKELLDRLIQFLLAQSALGKSCVAIFDEAQHLAPEVLEQVRVLSNLETDRQKLIQIVLVGQPELLDRIRTPQMAQLDQRVSIRCTLADLDAQETDRYIRHRLGVAGAGDQIRFTPRAVKEIYRASHGVPRLINLISDRALLAGYASQTHDIQPQHVRKAVAAVRGEDGVVDSKAVRAGRSWGRGAVFATFFAAAVIAGVVFWPRLASRLRSPDELAYQRTIAAASASDAERALTAFARRFGTSKHLDDVLLRLAQLEISRGDRSAAIQNLERLAQHTAAPLDRARAVVFASQAHLDGGDTTSACQRISPELTSSAASDTSLAHQLTTISSLCAQVGNLSTAAASPDTTARPPVGRDTVAKPAPKRGATTGAAP
jgi:type II secretory pathway predicted ATPase ExeA